MESNCDYTKAVFDHFQYPRNMGEMKDADGVGTVGNPSCGDVLKVMLRVDKDTIKDVKFQTFGCAAAIASSSMMTTLVKGKSLVLISEMGDKTQIASALFATRYNPWIVFFSVILALFLISVLAVFFGKFIMDRVDRRIVSKVSGILFVIIGIVCFF